MTVILILTSALAGVGLLLWLYHRYGPQPIATESTASTTDESVPAEEAECCGMHITCERDSLLASVSQTIEYYDDEELDRFAGREIAEYADNEIEEFRDILITMQPTDIAGWARSLQLRNIPLPEAVRDELLMIVAEARAS